MLKDKRGFEISLQFILTLIFVVLIMVVIGIWINSQASGSAIKKQILAKEICMITTSAEPGTTIMIEHEERIIIEAKQDAIVVKEGTIDLGYYYSCYIKDNIKFSRKDNITIIEIE